MSTKKTFNMDSENLTNGFQKAFDAIQESTVRITAKSGKEYFSLPLLFAIVIGIIFPLSLIIAVLLTLTSFIKIAVEREVKDTDSGIKVIGHK